MTQRLLPRYFISFFIGSRHQVERELAVVSVIMFTSPSLSARQAAEMNGQPPHQTTGVASKKPNNPIERPNGGMPGRPWLTPIGEKMISGRDKRIDMTKRRNRSATIAAPCPACSPCPIAACSSPIGEGANGDLSLEQCPWLSRTHPPSSTLRRSSASKRSMVAALIRSSSDRVCFLSLISPCRSNRDQLRQTGH
jgi:hypothetical protein